MKFLALSFLNEHDIFLTKHDLLWFTCSVIFIVVALMNILVLTLLVYLTDFDDIDDFIFL